MRPILLPVLLSLAMPGPARAAEVSLGQGIPSDCFFYLRRQASPELAALPERDHRRCQEHRVDRAEEHPIE